MSSGARSSRHVYHPAAVSPLERRDVPSAVTVPSDFQNFRATVVGGISHSRDGLDTIYINHGEGKTSDGRPIGMYGSLSADSKGVPGDPLTETGVAFFNVKGHQYGFALHGAQTEQQVSSGLADLSIYVLHIHRPATPHGRSYGETVGQGTMQLRRISSPGAADTFTATLIISPTTPTPIPY